MTSEEFERRFQNTLNSTLDAVDNKEAVNKVFKAYGATENDDPDRVILLLARTYADTLVHNLLKEFLVDNDDDSHRAK